MKKPLLLPWAATVLLTNLLVNLLLWGAAQAQPLAQNAGRIYRCGNEYTNTVPPDQKGCKLLEGGNVTVVQRPRADGMRVAASQATSAPSQTNPAGDAARITGAQAQRQRDSDARTILEAELRKTEARRSQLLAEYNNGEPEKMGPEFRNHQKYLDRVAEMKASIERNESDLAGLLRELDRLPESAASSESK